jgi:YD repeat-containing protein
MKNILGETKTLKEYHSNGEKSYDFITFSSGYSYECTYDKNGKELTFKNSNGYSSKTTYDRNGNELTFKDSDNYSLEFTYDENGNVLTYKDSND